MLFLVSRALGRTLVAAPRPAAWLLALAWYGLIWWSSSRPGSSEPSHWGWAVLSNSAHAPLFGLWAAWLALLAPRAVGWPRLERRDRFALLGVVALGGLVDELHQHWLSTARDFSLLDLTTDLVGAALALELVAHLASPQASPRSWALRLGLAAAGSFTAGGVATFLPLCFPGVSWL
jgi:VanZ family protein